MQYEYLFWSMLGVVALAMAGGAVTGWARSLAASLFACLAIAVLLATGVGTLLRYARVEEGQLMLGVAAFMFAWVIATAFSLMVRRILTRRASI